MFYELGLQTFNTVLLKHRGVVTLELPRGVVTTPLGSSRVKLVILYK